MQENNYIIRRAKIEDAGKLKECMEAAYSKYLDRLKRSDIPPMNIDYEEEIKLYPVWVIQFEEEIVGALILTFEKDYETISNIAIRPDFSGRGLGRKLLHFAEEEAKRRKYLEMRLATHVLLEENVSYYIYLGWQEISRDEKRVYTKKNIM